MFWNARCPILDRLFAEGLLCVTSALVLNSSELSVWFGVKFVVIKRFGRFTIGVVNWVNSVKLMIIDYSIMVKGVSTMYLSVIVHGYYLFFSPFFTPQAVW